MLIVAHNSSSRSFIARCNICFFRFMRGHGFLQSNCLIRSNICRSRINRKLPPVGVCSPHATQFEPFFKPLPELIPPVPGPLTFGSRECCPSFLFPRDIHACCVSVTITVRSDLDLKTENLSYDVRPQYVKTLMRALCTVHCALCT
jgi:hypothetical protein